MPLVSLARQREVVDLVKSALEKEREAKRLYSEAEGLLLKELTSSYLLPMTNNISDNIYLSHLIHARRADAEYFFNQKLTYQDTIKTVRLGEVATVLRGIDTGRKAYRESGKLLLRVSNITSYGLLRKSQKYIDEALYIKLRTKYQPQIGEVLVVKDGKPGVACVVTKPITGIISEGIVRLRINSLMEISPEYLCVCLNSGFCKEQIKADVDGSMVPHWKVERIKWLRIPVVESGAQREITRLMKKAEVFFQESEVDLFTSKKLVDRLLRGFSPA
jgi:hypothetical protein